MTGVKPKPHDPFRAMVNAVTLINAEPWMAKGNCVGQPPDWWFPADSRSLNSHNTAHAMELCKACPVRERCFLYAIDYDGWPKLTGIWGGVTESRRAQIIRNRKRKRTAVDAVRWIA